MLLGLCDASPVDVTLSDHVEITRVVSVMFSARVNFVAWRMAALKDRFHSCSRRRAGEYQLAREPAVRDVFCRGRFSRMCGRTLEEGRSGEVDPKADSGLFPHAIRGDGIPALTGRTLGAALGLADKPSDDHYNSLELAATASSFQSRPTPGVSGMCSIPPAIL